MRLAVIGAGSWGTAIAKLASANASVGLWTRRTELATAINTDRENAEYLPGVRLSYRITATTDFTRAVNGAAAVLVAVPSHGYRDVLKKASGIIPTSIPVISLAKGIEVSTGLRMSEVTLDVLDGHDPSRVGALSGPNLSEEIMQGQPAATVLSMPDRWVGREIQSILGTPRFRVYTNPDLIGVEVAGATKNVIALAAGVSLGMGFGMNTMAGLATRGLAEMTRLGVVLGGEALTFGGLAGVGDLMATCGSPSSRNHQVGYRLGQGREISGITTGMKTVAEAVRTTEAVLQLAARHGVEMPIAEAVGRILYQGETVHEAMRSLMDRVPTQEGYGILA
ncbi:MAG: NAD(P)-dependent glycerol-3-phosphate dehydrogenase [bacterium]|nr:NAD(P)-dependent glycerol-3-phosphate dehydrogenase [bacterium]MDE0353746.1 NAD(P)-dependent glycerol-3-phosphate dehydrogenase [bacterium]